MSVVYERSAVDRPWRLRDEKGIVGKYQRGADLEHDVLGRNLMIKTNARRIKEYKDSNEVMQEVINSPWDGEDEYRQLQTKALIVNKMIEKGNNDLGDLENEIKSAEKGTVAAAP